MCEWGFYDPYGVSREGISRSCRMPWIVPERVRRVSEGDPKVNPKAEICGKENLHEFPHTFSLHLFRHARHPLEFPFVNHRVLEAPASPDSCDVTQSLYGLVPGPVHGRRFPQLWNRACSRVSLPELRRPSKTALLPDYCLSSVQTGWWRKRGAGWSQVFTGS